MIDLPESLNSSAWGPRLRAAVDAVTSAGAALTALRGAQVRATELGSQLKTSVDLAAEGWVLGLLRGTFPEDGRRGGSQWRTTHSGPRSGTTVWRP